jgi:predicted phosphodiesterase
MLRPLWAGCDRVVVNGDAAELQLNTCRVAAAEAVLELQRLCDDDGVELVLLSGNHDAFISDRRHLLLDAGRVLITHGDAIHPAVSPWSHGGAERARLTAEASDRMPIQDRADLTHRLDLARHVGHSEFLRPDTLKANGSSKHLLLRPWRLAAVAWAWLRTPRWTADLVHRFAPDAEVAVIGHTHRQGQWRVETPDGPKTIINTGAFAWPAKPWAVLHRPGHLRVHHIKRAGEMCELGDVAGQVDLAPLVAARKAA